MFFSIGGRVSLARVLCATVFLYYRWSRCAVDLSLLLHFRSSSLLFLLRFRRTLSFTFTLRLCPGGQDSDGKKRNYRLIPASYGHVDVLLEWAAFRGRKEGGKEPATSQLGG